MTPERVFVRSLALVAGVATTRERPPLGGFPRPLGGGESSFLHGALWIGALADVVVRLGGAPADDFNQRFWEGLMAAAPAATGGR